MKDLLDFILKGLLNGADYSIEETEEEGRIVYSIKTEAENAGLVIGKGGKMIKAIRNLLKVRATLEKKVVNVVLSE